MNIISSTEKLNELIAKIEQSTDFVAIDTEFLREKTYYAKLCLIQVATHSLNAIIDPLAEGINLESFFSLLQNQKIVKVFFAGRQDLEILYFESHGVIPAPIFDCQIAAMLCGYDDFISYQQLVLSLLKIKLDKSSQLTDWSTRPLSQEQLTYALHDVTYLCDIYAKLTKKLKKAGRESWVQEELKPLYKAETYDPPIEEAWLRLKTKRNSQRELAIIQRIAVWREDKARKHNLPRSWVLKDEIISEIANIQPKNEQEFLALKTVKKFGIRHKFDYKILCDIVNEVTELPMQTLPLIDAPAVHIGNSSLVEMLQFLLKLVAHENHIATSMIATTANLKQMVLQNTCEGTAVMHGWRAKIFGHLAEELLQGKLGFCFKNNRAIYYKI
ncbi:ribonuclease D [Bartonella sp. TP]|uniref:ribonuclease D n=1 Tax=Bartonella sp. TP TaxID=3057550 RepID=UPI0025B0A682|nr:ribonuclease D [Bartonella sp. TP]MDN5249406.1 ribonuclease D [Alphaproteobacteria bacterium]WJW79947.1 ribonuclease D [Bartonella sp. TP]